MKGDIYYLTPIWENLHRRSIRFQKSKQFRWQLQQFIAFPIRGMHQWNAGVFLARHGAVCVVVLSHPIY